LAREKFRRNHSDIIEKINEFQPKLSISYQCAHTPSHIYFKSQIKLMRSFASAEKKIDKYLKKIDLLPF
jgi:hypothetical protein